MLSLDSHNHNLWGKGCQLWFVGEQAEAREGTAHPELSSERVGSGGRAWPSIPKQGPILPTLALSYSSSSWLIFSYYKQQSQTVSTSFWGPLPGLALSPASFGDTPLDPLGQEGAFQVEWGFQPPWLPLVYDGLLETHKTQSYWKTAVFFFFFNTSVFTHILCHNVSISLNLGREEYVIFPKLPCELGTIRSQALSCSIGHSSVWILDFSSISIIFHSHSQKVTNKELILLGRGWGRWMLVPAWHLLTSCKTLSHVNFLEPGFQSV